MFSSEFQSVCCEQFLFSPVRHSLVFYNRGSGIAVSAQRSAPPDRKLVDFSGWRYYYLKVAGVVKTEEDMPVAASMQKIRWRRTRSM